MSATLLNEYGMVWYCSEVTICIGRSAGRLRLWMWVWLLLWLVARRVRACCRMHRPAHPHNQLTSPAGRHNRPGHTPSHRQHLLISINQSINQSCIFRVVQVIKSLQDPLEAGDNLPGISDNVRERGLEQKR